MTQTMESPATEAGIVEPLGIELDAIASDTALQRDGVWVDYRGARFRIASAYQADYQRESNKLLNLNGPKLAGPNAWAQTTYEVIAPAVAQYLLRDWSGIIENGKPVPYTKERGAKTLSDPRFFDLMRFVLLNARSVDLFRAQLEKDAAGN